ncbi:Hypothetical predicted protein [Paramuricea clavata]|uniref:Uncharacterized protein n=1 Tax=Paramuricea clavata TaxID=317549 RepID=A0A7D9LWU3_PARCT|nr:Hypothetical predicted protein [Paramuricea clavata]
MLAIESIETSIDKMEKSLKEHMEKTIHSSGRILTGRKTAHDFDESQPTYLQALRKAKQQQEQEKEEEAKCSKNNRDFKEDCSRVQGRKGMYKGRFKRGDHQGTWKERKKWAIALTSSSCKLLDGSAKYMVCNILGVGGNASSDGSGSWGEANQDDSGRDDNASDYCESDDGRTDDINRSDVGSDIGSDVGSDAGSDAGSVGRDGGHACGNLIGFEKEIADDDSDSSYDVGPYWETSGCIPYCQPILI